MLRERCVGKKGLRGRCVPFMSSSLRVLVVLLCVETLFLAFTLPARSTGVPSVLQGRR